MTLKTAGSPARAATGHWDLATAPPSFAVTADTRASGGSNAGFRVVFGQTDVGQNYYSLVVSPASARPRSSGWSTAGSSRSSTGC